MSTHWNRAFAVLLALSLTSAVLSVVVVQQTESSFAAATHEVTRETAVYDTLVGALIVESANAHTVLDRGSVTSSAFVAADAAALAAFNAAIDTYNSDVERAWSEDAKAQWLDTYGMVRTLVADPAKTDAFAADTGPAGDEAHGVLAVKADAISATLHRLDLVSRSALQARLDQAHDNKTKLLLLLAAIFVLSVGATFMYARRMARRVVQPIRSLWESADRFGGGDLSHRVELHNDDEIGELAVRFNSMAETIDMTHRRLTVEAHHDALTGLVNRGGFIGYLDAAVAPGAVGAGSVSLMFIDLDDFKNVNDELGHAAGDELLRQVADRLSSAARASDVVCRLGGDEFAILVGGQPAGSDVAIEIAGRVLGVLEQPFSLHGALIRVGASIGIATQADTTESGDFLLRAADVAMYSAKAQGKHRWQLFDADVHGPVVDDVSAILARLGAEELDATPLA